jgi:hypothetical protein
MQGRGEKLGWTAAFELAPAAIFGAAAAFAESRGFVLPQADPAPLGIGFGSFCAAWLFLRLFRGKSDSYAMPTFDLGAFDRELVAVAGAAEQEPQPDLAEDELVLEDVLAAIDPAARVVHLFQANGTAGELHERIERHLRAAPRASAPPDATQELHEAIAALRRSLR